MHSRGSLPVLLAVLILVGSLWWTGLPSYRSDLYLRWVYIRPKTTFEIIEVQWFDNYKFVAVLAQLDGDRVPYCLSLNLFNGVRVDWQQGR